MLAVKSSAAFPGMRDKCARRSFVRVTVRVTSRGMSVMDAPLAYTMRAASGSAYELYSAAGVMFPQPTAPPIMTSSRIRLAMDGSRSRAMAIFDSGPVATTVMVPAGAFMIRLARKTAACSLRLSRVHSGNLGPSSPDSP